ncbi:hypothetical protein [Parasphingorhabdus sp.]|uniref:hypothetical protein n=1 Tax=Parasphingorhabdus sp. TaxID=2709688 RepID=UPI002F9218AE
MNRIPIANAVIAANKKSDGKIEEVVVLARGDRRDSQYGITLGAAESRWRNHPDQRMGLLFEAAWHLVSVFELSHQDVHRALLSIEEYAELEGQLLA